MTIKIPDVGTGIPANQTGDSPWLAMKKVAENFSDQSNAASRLVGKSNGQVAAYDASGGIGVQNYVQAGTGAPKIAFKKIERVYPSVANNGEFSIPIGIDQGKLLSVNVMVFRNNGGRNDIAYPPNANHDGYNYYILFSDARIYMKPVNDASLINGRIVAFITYEV